jgi:RNA polymerase sigma-70 factor (ECF subfamily)
MSSEAGREAANDLGAEDPSPRAWAPIVEAIRNGDASAVEELYNVFAKGIRYLLWRQLGLQDLDDRVHDIFLMVVQSIQRGEVREPERLMGYVRTVVRRQTAGYIEGAMNSRRRQIGIEATAPLRDWAPNPEKRAIDEQNSEVAKRVLHSLPTRDREVLIRFYLDEQAPEQICADLGITETQFRLVKSRAKARYSELARRRFAMRSGFRV